MRGRIEQLAAVEPAIRDQVAALLDQLTAPLTAREIEQALMERGGLSRGQRRALVGAIKGLSIVAVGREC